MERVKARICILDLDGVVFDVSQRLAIAESEARGDKKLFWDIFLREDLVDLDRPREAGLDAVRKCMEKGHHILFLTGRPDRLLDKTVEQLRSVGISLGNGVYLVMRPSGNVKNIFKPPIYVPKMPEKIDSRVFKLRVLHEISRIYDIAEIHEDDEEILREAWKSYHRAELYLHVGDGYKIYRGRRLF